VRAEAVVTEVAGRRIKFDVTASDDVEVIGSGTHERIVIDLARFSQSLAMKNKH
jgi:fluoroacetyl-CoA thioesterase